MKKHLVISLIFVVCSTYNYAQNINIYFTPLVSSTSYNSIEFNELLNLGIQDINNRTIKPKLKFGYDFKPGINVQFNYDVYKIGMSFFISNSFTGPVPIAQQYNGDGTATHNFTLGEGRKLISTKETKVKLIENEYNIYLGYSFLNNFTTFLSFSNYTVLIVKASLHTHNYPDSVSLDIFEKINSVELGTNYKFNLLKIFTLSFHSSIGYIYNFNEISPRRIIENNNLGGYFNNIYTGYSWSIGTKLEWKALFLRYKYSQMQAEKNYFKNSLHKFEIGVKFHALSIDPNKLFGD